MPQPPKPLGRDFLGTEDRVGEVWLGLDFFLLRLRGGRGVADEICGVAIGGVFYENRSFLGSTREAVGVFFTTCLTMVETSGFFGISMVLVWQVGARCYK